MPGRESNSHGRSLAVHSAHELSDLRREPRSVRSGGRHWQPPEGLSPDDVQAVITAANCQRDRLLLRVLWATGARISEC
jgi:integrase